jgi:hypothetical protein
MLRAFKIDQISTLEPENSYPMKLGFVARIIVFSYACVDTPPAADAPGKFKAVAPQGSRQSFLCANVKFLPVSLRVSFFQLGNDALLFFGGHFVKMFLEEILCLVLRARGEYGKGQTCQGGHGKIAEKVSSGVTFLILILHRGFLPDEKEEVRASML